MRLEILEVFLEEMTRNNFFLIELDSKGGTSLKQGSDHSRHVGS